MSFLDKLFGSKQAPKSASQPSVNTAPASYEPSSLYAAAQGSIVDPSSLPDPVFAGQLMGPTQVIQPSNGNIYAPACGTIAMVYPTGHAFGLRTSSGAEILVHIGIDTVALNGKGFKVHVKEGQKVTPEQLVVTMDTKTVESAGYCSSVMTILTNPDSFQFSDSLQSGSAVSPREAIGKIVPVQG